MKRLLRGRSPSPRAGAGSQPERRAALLTAIAIVSGWHALLTLALLGGAGPRVAQILATVCIALFGLASGLTWYAHRLSSQALARARRALQEQQGVEDELRRLAGIVEQNPASIIVTGLDGLIEYVNPRFTHITGYSPDEVLGKNPNLLKSGLTPAETYRDLWSTISAGKEWRGELVNRKKDGTIYYDIAIIAPMTGEDGTVRHYLAVNEDITPSMKKRQNILWQRDLAQALSGATSIQAALTLCLQRTLEAANLDCGGIYLADRTGGGFTLAVSEGLSDEFLHIIQHVPAGSPRWQIVMAGKAVYTIYEQIRTQTSPVVTNEGLRAVALIPVLHQGQVIACFNLASRRLDDIAPDNRGLIEEIALQIGNALVRVQVQEELQRSHTELSLSEARFRSLFEQTHDAVFIIDLNGHYLAANQRATDLFGYSAEELLRLTIQDTSAESDQTQDILTRLLAGEQVELFERRYHKKNGQTFPAEVNTQLIRDSQGSPTHIQSTLRDISQRKKSEEALMLANEQLNQRMMEVEELQAELKEQALRDPLTGLFNRRFLAETLPLEVLRAEREGAPLSVIVTDIDHFKILNDTHGHQVGDQFLVEIARLLKNSARGMDIVCRYGGEEFLLVLPGATLEAAENRAQAIRQKCAEIAIPHEGRLLRTTLSFGVAGYPDHGKDPEQIIIKADKAMYLSKNNGRNRVSVWEDPVA